MEGTGSEGIGVGDAAGTRVGVGEGVAAGGAVVGLGVGVVFGVGEGDELPDGAFTTGGFGVAGTGVLVAAGTADGTTGVPAWEPEFERAEAPPDPEAAVCPASVGGAAAAGTGGT